MSETKPPKADQPAQFSIEGDIPGKLWSVPAVFVNRFFFTGMGPNVRLVFAEQETAAGETHMRTACVMTTSDVIQLRDLLTHMLMDVQIVDSAAAVQNG